MSTEELRFEKDKLEILKWIQYSFTKPATITSLSPRGQLLEYSILQEYEKFKSWALKQIEVV